MSDLTTRLIAALEMGGLSARESLRNVGELLRKAWRPGFTPFDDALEAEEMTSEEILRLRDALYNYCKTEQDSSVRRSALAILAKEGRQDLKGPILNELHGTMKECRLASRELFQLLLALEDVGENVFPHRSKSRSLSAVQTNIDVASEYLHQHGIQVPWS